MKSIAQSISEPCGLTLARLAHLSDEEVMAHIQAGHDDALAVLFDRYHRLVVSVAFKILRDLGEAEDVTQVVFLEIYKASAQFDPVRGTTKVWLLQYVYHRSFNRRHYLSLRGLYDNTANPDAVAERSSILHSQARTAMESSHLVKQALGSLNSAQRKVLELAFYEGLTMREISEKTGESFDSARHNYYRGLEKLRTLLCRERESGIESASPRERVPYAKP